MVTTLIVYFDGMAVYTCKSLDAAMTWIAAQPPAPLHLQDVSSYSMEGIQRAWRVQSSYFIEQVDDMRSLVAAAPHE